LNENTAAPAAIPTAEQRQLIDALGALLLSEPKVEALWLAGSLGKGGGDEYSDVDLLVLARDGGAADLSQRLAARLAEVAQPVLVNRLYGGRVLNVVTDDWRRFDLSFIEATDLARYDAAALTPLFNRSGRQPPTPPKAPYQAPPERVVELANEFLRVLGLSVGALGRREHQLALTGIDILRRLTLDLMLEENGVSPAARGGALRRRPFLTDDQRAELAALPPLSADDASVNASNRAFARIFLPRARRLASRVGATWPEAFEEATRRRLKARLGLDLD
jgi:predicted nucleotidyltransferase